MLAGELAVDLITKLQDDKCPCKFLAMGQKMKYSQYLGRTWRTTPMHDAISDLNFPARGGGKEKRDLATAAKRDPDLTQLLRSMTPEQKSEYVFANTVYHPHTCRLADSPEDAHPDDQSLQDSESLTSAAGLALRQARSRKSRAVSGFTAASMRDTLMTTLPAQGIDVRMWSTKQIEDHLRTVYNCAHLAPWVKRLLHRSLESVDEIHVTFVLQGLQHLATSMGHYCELVETDAAGIRKRLCDMAKAR